MRALVSSLINSIPQLLNVVALLAFVFFLWGVLGVQLFAGIQHSRCRMTPYPVEIPDSHMSLPAECYPLYGVDPGECAASLNGSGTEVQPLYFEMMDRFFDPPDLFLFNGSVNGSAAGQSVGGGTGIGTAIGSLVSDGDSIYQAVDILKGEGVIPLGADRVNASSLQDGQVA